MLQLSRRNICHSGYSYICASCRHKARPWPSLRHAVPSTEGGHRGRPFSTNLSRYSATDGLPNASETAGNSPKGKGGKGKSKQAPENSKRQKLKGQGSKDKSGPDLKQPAEAGPESQKPQTDAERQLFVLQGALAALKNVLTDKKIDVSQLMKLNQSSLAPTPSETQPDSKKPKQNAKTKKAVKKHKKDGVPVVKLPPSAKESAGTNAALASKKPHKPPHGKRQTNSVNEKPRDKKAPPKGSSPSPVSSDSPNSEASPRSLVRLQYSQSLMPHVQRSEAGTIIGKPFSGEAPPPSVKTRPPALRTKPGKKSKKTSPFSISQIDSTHLRLIPIETQQPPVPALSYGLERVLFNSGVYQLQDNRSRVFNFDPYLSKIMPIQEFDFNALKQYVTSSKDRTLISIAKENEKKYTGSTSSMTSMLAHFHYLLSSWRDINSSMLSQQFEPESTKFTQIMRGPAATFLHWKDGTYAIDADKEYDTANVLSMLGKSMEKLLTLPKEDFERYRHENSDQISQEERDAEESYHYTGFQDFMMRSQLDAHDPRLPGTGMFDLKTRAVISIRMDAKGFQKGLGYEIRKRFGQWESFEREYYDMIRSAFLKYSLQVRMGRMDGIFVAYHNTQRIFGFQYIPLEEMDLSLHGTSNTTLGNREFKVSLNLLNEILDRATKKYPEKSLRLHFETRPSTVAPYMYIFAKPVEPEEIATIQNANKASIDKFEQEIMGLAQKVAEDSNPENDEAVEEHSEEEEPLGSQELEVAETKTPSEEPLAIEESNTEETLVSHESTNLVAWEQAQQLVEDAIDAEELGVSPVREAIEDALEQSGLLHGKSSSETQEYVDALLEALTSSEVLNAAESKPGATHDDGSLARDQVSLPESPDVAAEDSEPKISELLDSSRSSTDGPAEEEKADVNESTVEPPTSSSASVSPGQPSKTIEDSGSKAEVISQDAVKSTSREVSRRLDDSSTVEVAPADSSINTVRETEEDVDEEEEEEEEDADEEVEANDSEEHVHPSLASLKDFILRLTRRIDEKASSADNALEDTSKLREFERILGNLISESKAEKTQPRSGEISSNLDNDEPTETQSTDQQIVDELKELVSDSSKTASEAQDDDPLTMPVPPVEDTGEDLFGMVLTIKNKVNNQYVNRPDELKRTDRWVVEYNIEELSDDRARNIYEQVKERRKKVLCMTGDREKEWYQMWKGTLARSTKRGRAFREKETQKTQGKPVHVVGQEKPLEWHDVFGTTEQGSSEALDRTIQPNDSEPNVSVGEDVAKEPITEASRLDALDKTLSKTKFANDDVADWERALSRNDGLREGSAKE
ncbi:mitochondrial protein Pet127-domain-containing protein [Xylariaceae sp. FL0016]|nr:mitochondrial protein Pet127-domain-containing protein [Xylariaceae sp. FL0016]